MSLFFYIMSIVSSIWLYFNFIAEYYIIAIIFIILGFFFDLRKNRDEDYSDSYYNPDISYENSIIKRNKKKVSSVDYSNDFLMASNVLSSEDMPKPPQFVPQKKDTMPVIVEEKAKDETTVEVDDFYDGYMEVEYGSAFDNSKNEKLFSQKNKEKGNLYEAQIHNLFLQLKDRYNLSNYGQRGFTRGLKDKKIDMYYEFGSGKKACLAVQCKNRDSDFTIDKTYMDEFIGNSFSMNNKYVKAVFICNDIKTIKPVINYRNKDIDFIEIPSYERVNQIGRDKAIDILTRQLNVWGKKKKGFYKQIIVSLINCAVEDI